MAIYGVGSKFNTESKDVFFHDGKFIIGWNQKSGRDLFEALSHFKVGDILYIKSNRPGSKKIRIKAIGIVTKSFLQCLSDGEYENVDITDWESVFVRCSWIITDEFIVSIPKEEGKMTNIRAATIYEEMLPYVQSIIVSKLLEKFS